jgi:hypothetical protein
MMINIVIGTSHDSTPMIRMSGDGRAALIRDQRVGRWVTLHPARNLQPAMTNTAARLRLQKKLEWLELLSDMEPLCQTG